MTGLQAACGYSYSRVDVPQSSTAETNAICTSKIKQGQTYDHCLFKATNVCVNLGFKLVQVMCTAPEMRLTSSTAAYVHNLIVTVDQI